MPRWLAVLALACVAHAPAPARADAIGPPPADCPPGTIGVASHCSVCAPDRCAGDADCEAGARCEERSYCTRTFATCGGWGGPGATDARPVCGGGTTCPAETTCTPHRVCAPGPPATDATAPDASDGREHARYGCACRAGQRATPTGAALAGVAMLAMLAARRRRARR